LYAVLRSGKASKKMLVCLVVSRELLVMHEPELFSRYE